MPLRGSRQVPEDPQALMATVAPVCRKHQASFLQRGGLASLEAFLRACGQEAGLAKTQTCDLLQSVTKTRPLPPGGSRLGSREQLEVSWCRGSGAWRCLTVKPPCFKLCCVPGLPVFPK